MPGKNAFYAQSGGPTAVINASACGVLQTARQHSDQINKVYAGRDGIIGLRFGSSIMRVSRLSASTLAGTIGLAHDDYTGFCDRRNGGSGAKLHSGNSEPLMSALDRSGH
jgi:hypothetical protein